MVRYSALQTGVVWCVIEDLVLFIYSVQPSCKFHWLLVLYALHLTGLSSANLPSHVIT